MSLTPAQKTTVATWIADGANLSAVQKKLREEFKISMTYMDVRFLVDDLNLTLKDPAPKVDASDVTQAPAAPAATAEQNLAAGDTDSASVDAEAPEAPIGDNASPAAPGGPSSVTVVVDAVTLIPGAIAGGTVTFSDGVTGKWIIDQQYRPGFTEISQPGYRPSPADAQAFMQELGRAMQARGF
ncbi:MAG: hypothetical protein WCG63_03270 [Opitutaceae bacterium]|jgi:hypothetical protein